MDVLRAGAAGVPALQWSSKSYKSGLREYSDSLKEPFDIDLRDPITDNEHCFACGFMILGNWQVTLTHLS